MPKKPITVFITEGKHKTQPWIVRIEQGKTDTILSQRYTRASSAKLGAIRKLKAQPAPAVPGEHFVPYQDGSIRWVKFVVKRKPTKP